MKISLILILVLALFLLGCSKSDANDKMQSVQEQPPSSSENISVGNASFLYEVAELMENSTSNSTNSSE